MNNYSFFQKKFHEIALSSKFVREATFDFENLIFKENNFEDNHVFVCGLARSGTTILLNELYKTNEFASLSYSDMPFILAPNSWNLINVNQKDIKLQERAHNDGIKISTKSPEAFEETFWKTFNQCDIETPKKFKRYINNIVKKNNKYRYLSKNNQNIRRLDYISKIFPDSKFLIPYRNPVQQAYSLLTQHNNFNERSGDDVFISKYMGWIGHTEFGPQYEPIISKNIQYKNSSDLNHWMEQWYPNK